MVFALDPSNSVIRRFWFILYRDTNDPENFHPNHEKRVSRANIFLFFHENICCGSHKKCLGEALLMSTEVLLMCTYVLWRKKKT